MQLLVALWCKMLVLGQIEALKSLWRAVYERVETFFVEHGVDEG